MLIGYARVSAQDQSLALQKHALEQAGCKRLFTDTASGAQADRTGLEEAVAYVRQGDTLVVWKPDRLGRARSATCSRRAPTCMSGAAASGA